jgi:acetyl esterase/lipase
VYGPRVESVVFKRTDDCEIGLDVYPAADGQRNAPVVVWIHGGALIVGTRRSMQPALRDGLALAGFAQVSIDYRLAPETKLPAILTDVVDAFAWVRGDGARRFGLDATRIGVVGRSAGGYLALMTGRHVQPSPRAVVSFYGYGDVAGSWYSRPDPFYCQQPSVSEAEARSVLGDKPISDGAPEREHFYLYCRQQGLWPREVVGLDPDRDPRGFDPYCPVRTVWSGFPPTMLLHGTADTDVPYQQSVDMAAALARAGATHELVTIPDGGHGFDHKAERDASASGRALATALDFLSSHV